MTPREYPAFGKMFYGRGTSWVSIFLGYASIATMVKVYEDFFKYQLGMTVEQVLVVLIPCYIVGCVIIGYIDFRSGIMKEESNVNYKAAPLANEMRENVKKILEKMEKLE